MRLKTFTASTMKEAIAVVRQEMGPDAIIVSAYERPRGRGVEVRAAVEGRAHAPEAPAKAPAPARPSPAPPERPEPPSAIAQLARRRVGPPPAKRALKPHEAVLRASLAYHGLDEARAASLVDTARKLEGADPAEILATVIDARFAFAPLPAKPRRPVMLVGGPGVGKTVTCAKLAARARLANEPVAVITTDTLRTGAVEQLGKLLSLMGTRLVSADAPESLEAALARAAKAGAATFIDTPGTNPLALGERRDLRRFLAAGDIEPVLVLAAGGDAAETADQAKLFAEIGVRRFIMTRLDAARRLGGLMAAAYEAKLGIAQISLSPYLSEALSPLSAASLARILIAQSGNAQAGGGAADNSSGRSAPGGGAADNSSGRGAPGEPSQKEQKAS
jgi:flagellar biosynthesis protein FlhF